MKRIVIIAAILVLTITGCKSKDAEISTSDNYTGATSVQDDGVSFINSEPKTDKIIDTEDTTSGIETPKETSAIIRVPSDTQSVSETVVNDQTATAQMKTDFSSETDANASKFPENTKKPAVTTTIKQTTTRDTLSAQSDSTTLKSFSTTIATTGTKQTTTNVLDDEIELPMIPFE